MSNKSSSRQIKTIGSRELKPGAVLRETQPDKPKIDQILKNIDQILEKTGVACHVRLRPGVRLTPSLMEKVSKDVRTNLRRMAREGTSGGKGDVSVADFAVGPEPRDNGYAVDKFSTKMDDGFFWVPRGDAVTQEDRANRAMERLATICAPLFPGEQAALKVDTRGLSERQAAVMRCVRYLQHYMNTYDGQGHFLDYSDETIMKDVLYGLGVALWGKDHEMHNGFKKTKARIAEFLAADAKKEAKTT